MYMSLSVGSHSSFLQQDLGELERWERDWDMSFNPQKCQVLKITKRKTPIETSYTLHGTTLESVDSAKYLGVTISNDLTWNKHIDNITNKANQTLGFLRRNLKVRSEQIKSTAYKTLVRPQLEYCSPTWAPYTDTQITQIEAVQRRAARWVKHDYGRLSSVTEMLKSLEWRQLELRRIDQRLTLFYNMVNDLVAIKASDYIQLNQRPRRNQHPLTYRHIQAKTDYYKFSFFPRTVVHWNALPAEVVSLPPKQFSAAVSGIEHIAP